VDRTAADIERQGKGSLLLWITGFGAGLKPCPTPTQG